MESAARWFALPLAAVFAAGVWVVGGLISNSFRVSMALVAGWYAAAGAGALVSGLRRRALRAPADKGRDLASRVQRDLGAAALSAA